MRKISRFFSGLFVAVTLVFSVVGDAAAIEKGGGIIDPGIGKLKCSDACPAGQFCLLKSCADCPDGYYCPGTSANAGSGSGRTNCNTLTTGMPTDVVDGGIYTSVSPRSAATNCRYTPPAVTPTDSECDSVVAHTVSYTGITWPTTVSSYYTTYAKAGSYVINQNHSPTNYTNLCALCPIGTATSEVNAATYCNLPFAGACETTAAAGSTELIHCSNDTTGLGYCATINWNNGSPNTPCQITGCNKGAYYSSANNGTCTRCAAGKYQGSFGSTATSCTNISANKWNTGCGTNANGGVCATNAYQTNTYSGGACATNAQSSAGAAYCTCKTGYSIGGGTNTATYDLNDRSGSTCAARTYTITYKTGNTIVGTQTCNYGDTVTPLTASQLTNVPSAINPSYWDGVGWASTYNTINGGTNNFTCSGNMTKYAVWTRKFQMTWFASENATSTTTDWAPEQNYYNTNATTAGVSSVETYPLYMLAYHDSGWVPVGWALNDTTYNATVVASQTGATPTTVAPAANVAPHYYAIYHRTPKIIYNKGSGTGGSTADSYCTEQRLNSANPDGSVSSSDCTLSASGFTAPSGYSFAYWVDSGANGQYSAGGSYDFSREWNSSNYETMTAMYSTTITLNKNSGSGTINGTSGTGNASKICYYGSSCSFGSAAGLSQTGYTFTGGWGTSSSCTGTTTSFTNPTGTYYACKTANSYTISYTLNSGTQATSGVPTSYTYGTGATINGTPTRSGYTFAGWTGSNGSTAQTTVTIGTTATGNKSYTANWTGNTITLNWDENGGGAINNGSCTYGGNLVLPSAPTRTGYTFDGWSVDGSLHNASTTITNGCVYANVGVYSGTSTIIQAKWTANTYSISYTLNGGSYGTNHPTTGTYNSEFTVDNPTHAHGTFNGWAVTNMDSTTHYYGTSSANTSSTATSWTNSTITSSIKKFKNLRATSGTVTFTAKWTCATGYTGDDCHANTYAVTYSCGDGTGTAPSGPTPATYNATYTPAANSCSRNGYTFAGWKVSGTNDIKAAGTGFTWTYTEAKTLTAQWSLNSYSITYDLNGGAGTTPSATTCNHGQSCALNPGTATNFYKPGYYLGGWSVNPSDAGTFSLTFTGPTIVYAKWIACSAGTYHPNAAGTAANTCTVCGDDTYSDGAASSCSACNTTNGYHNTGNTATAHRYSSSCKTTCEAGQRVASANAACSTPTGNWYTTEQHTVAYGSTSGSNVQSCPTNWSTPNTTTQTDHDAQNDCERTIRLNKNGGSGTINGTGSTTSPVNKTCKYNTACDFGSASSLTQTGYTFATGWATGTSGTCNSTTTSFAITATDTNVDYRACKAANTYTISYALNSGTAGSSAPTSATFDTAFTVSNPTRSGYTFAGWKITGMESGITHYYGSGTDTAATKNWTKETSFKNLRATSGTVTFTAQWCQNCASVTGGNCSLTTAEGTTCTYSTTCNAGRYLSAGAGTRAPTCSTCANGYFQPSNNSNATSCTACAIGSYSTTSSGSSSCTACPAGRTTSGTGTGYNSNVNTACATLCPDYEGVATWNSPQWTNNYVEKLCSVDSYNSYTLTIVAGNGISQVCWDGDCSATSVHRTISYGTGVGADLVSVSYKLGYSGLDQELSGSGSMLSTGAEWKYVMGAGNATLTLNATDLRNMKGYLQFTGGGRIGTYGNANETRTLTAGLTVPFTDLYDSGVTIHYQFYERPVTSTDTCTGTWSSITVANDTVNTLTKNAAEYLGYRCYYFDAYAVGDGGLTSGHSGGSGTQTLRADQNAITFNATQNSGTLSGTSPLYQRYNDANLYTTPTGSTIATVPTASKTGNNVWTGWYTAASGGSQIYNASNTLSSATVSGWISGSKWVATGAKTLYAQYGACGCTKGSNVSECTVTGVSNNKCQYSYTCNSGYHVGSSGTTATGTFEGVVGAATNTSPACSVNSYTITVKAGAGVSTVAATGWTNTGTASMSKSFNYGSTINLPNTVTPTRKNGYTGTSYAVTSGNCTINASNVVTVGAGACEITVSATGITAPTAVTISNGTSGIKTETFNYQAVPLTTSVTTPEYADGVSVNYQFKSANYTNSTCGSYSNVGSASTTSTYTVAKDAFRGYKCYSVNAYAVGDGGLTSSTIEATTPTVVRFVQRNVNFVVDPENGETISTGTTPTTLFSGYNTNKLYTTKHGSTQATIPTASKPGCKFNGWWTATSGGNQVLSASNVLTSATISGYTASSTWRNTSNKNVYAQFNCMNVSAPDKTLTYNGSAQSCANVTVTSPSGATVTYSTTENGTYGSAPTMTNVSESPITVYYKVSATGYTDYMGSYTCTMQKADCPITVKEGSTTLGTSSVVTLTYPTTKTLTVTSSCGNAVTLSSGNTSYVTVSGTTLSPVAVTSSNVTMTATVAESSNYNAASTTFLAKVNRGTCSGITLTPTSGTITYPNTTSTFNINWGNCNGTKTATSSDTDKATVALNSGNGSATVTFVNAGSATITVKSAQSAQYAQSTATYTATLVNGTPSITLKDGTTNVNAGSGSTAYNGTKTLTATCSNSATPTVSSGTTSVATANISNGTITLSPVATGTSRITVTCPATGHWDAVSTYYDWTVSNGTITATVSNPSKTYDGTALSCDGISNVSPSGATVEYAVKSGNTCGSYSTTVPSSITNVADSKTICYRISKTNYTTNSGEYTCTVSKANCTLGFNEISGSTPYGTNKTFTVTSNPSGGTLTVSPTATGTGINATASISGTTVTMTPRAVGNQTITVTSAATSNYNSCSKNYTLTVSKGNCTVNLSATSGTITYPTANTTFTASSTSGGTLTVSPTATGSGIHAIAAISNGTVTVTPQSAGTQTITVTSAATTNYNACSATYTATVNAKTITLKKNNGSGTCGGVTGTADGSMTCTYGGTCTAPSWNSSTCNITNGVKIFDGWATSASGAVAYAPNADLTNAPTTLYAHWTTPTCTVTNGSGTAVNTTTNTPKCTVTCDTGYHTSGTYTGTQNATSYSYTCEISSYTVTVKAGNGISTVAADGWTNTGTAQMNKSYNYNSTIDLSSVVTPTRKTGYTGTAYAVTSGNCTLSGSTVTVGAGNCEITVNATGLETPAGVSISRNGSDILPYNMGNNRLDGVTTTQYDSGVTVYYVFGNTETSTDSENMCVGDYTYGTASAQYYKVVSGTEYHGYRCYKVKIYATDGSLTSDTVEASNSKLVGRVQRSITFATNGGTLSGTSPRYARYNDANLYTTAWSDDTASVPTATKAGYTFSGWYTAATDGIQVYNASLELQPNVSNYTNASSQWIATGNKTLYAQWTPNTYTITYKTGNNTMGTQTCTYGTTVTLDALSTMSNIPVSSNYGWSFNGWATSVNTRYRNYGDGATTYSCTGDATLYGIWKRTVRFVYFASATATGTMLNSTRTQWYYNQTQTEAYEHSVDTLPLYTIEAPRNWEPQGWLLNSTENTTTGISVQTDTNTISVTPAADVPAYYHAIYTRVAKVTYDGNTNTGGSTANTTCDQVQIWNAVSASPAPAASSPSCTLANNGFTKTGYTFNKWALGSASGTQYAAGASYSFSNTSVNSGDTVTMYATWTANTNTPYKVYHYTKDLTGSAYTQNGSVDNLTGTSDASVTLSTLTRNITGFTYDKGFAGTAAAGTTMPAANTAVTTTTILPDGTRVISLYYNRNGYTITLNKNGGSGKVGSDTTVNSNPATITCTYGDTVTLPAYNSTTQLTKGTGATSAVFRGWADNNDCTATTCAYTGVECTGDKTVYAVWIVPTCAAGTGVGATSLNSVSGNAPVCNKTASNGNYCTSGTQTGTAGATSLTVTCTACPALTTGYSYVSGTGWTTYSQCKEEKGGANCSGGKLTKTATSASAWGNVVSTLTAPAGSYVNGESCNLCATGSYTATAGTQTSCTVCGNGTTTNGTGQTSCNATCVNNNNYDHAWATPTWNNNNPTNICAVSSCKKGSYFVSLPDGYTQLEYIASTGTQYIDTGYAWTSTTRKAYGKFYLTDYVAKSHLWASTRGSQYDMNPYFNTTNSTMNTYIGSSNRLTNTVVKNQVHELMMDVTASQLTNTLDGIATTVSLPNGAVPTNDVTVYLGHVHLVNNSQTYYPLKARWYSFSMWDNNVLVRNFIPAKRNSDNVLGMYDTVNGVFYTNAGSGTFVAGPALQGKNLFDYSIGLQAFSDPTVVWTMEIGGVTFALNQATGLYTASGLATGTGGRNSLRTQTFYLPAGTYTISATNSPVMNILLVNETTGNTIAQTQGTTTFTLTETTPLHFGLSRTLGTTYDDEFYLQIEQGSTATDYQPYGVSYANYCEECVGATYQATDGSVATACTACAAGYDYNTDNGKTAASMCQTNCAGGSTVITANQTCSDVGTGYWSAGGVVNYGSTGTRTACPTGLTTTGSGAGADEAGDCGRILHIGNYSMRLRSVQKTTPSLKFDTDNNGVADLYGNMGTTQRNMSSTSNKKFKVNRGGTTYYIYDDTAVTP